MLATIGRIALGAAATLAGGIAAMGCGIFRQSETLPKPNGPWTKDGEIVADVDGNKTLYLKEDPKNPQQFLGRVVGKCHPDGKVPLSRTAIQDAARNVINCGGLDFFKLIDPREDSTTVDCEPGRKFEIKVAGRCGGLRDPSEPL